MWLHDFSLHQIGFRRKSDRYWQCERRHGLVNSDHISVFSWSEQRLPDGCFVVELTEFHVTFFRGGEHLHFYYHEHAENHWHHGGNTSHNEIRRLGLDPPELRAAADAIARSLTEALGGTFAEDDE